MERLEGLVRSRPRRAGTALVIAPHPDDETLACGGAIALRRRAGQRVVVLFVTDGRCSHAAVLGIDTAPTPEEVAQCRREEAGAAAAALGVPAEDLQFLGLREGEIEAGVPSSVGDDLARLLAASNPIDALFLPHPEDAHPTHRAVHALVMDAIAEIDLNPLQFRYIVWPPDAVPEDGVRFEVDIAEVLARKRAAIDCYQSQIGLAYPSQSRPVLEPAFVATFRDRRTETFWL
jgi:LmbE family N-acetylglucosaminyl deacetylase